MGKGFFIVFDGIDGSGTTTHSKLLSDWLKQKYEVFLTKEPSNNEIGNLIRTYLNTSLPPAVDALLFAADRALHCEEIQKALDKDKIVISDRYIDSSFCYQGVDLNEDWIELINKFTIRANLTIILDVKPEIALNRKNDSSAKFENITFLSKVRVNFLNRARKLHYPIIDTSKPLEDAQKQIQQYADLYLQKYRP